MAVSINIVCLDVPYPANYGGAINMFHKIRCLHQQGVEIYLHCYTYGTRRPQQELEKYCRKVNYYQRKTGLASFFSILPYNVKSRKSKELKKNLQKNNYPILFDALHTCYYINDKEFSGRLKLFRESNIEHNYFYHLAKNENQFLKKLYLYTEAFKLKLFEKYLSAADAMLVVSTEDEQYFKKQFPNNKVYYLPSFHQNDELGIRVGKSDYCLYHGNLSVSENYQAASWLIEHVFSKINHPVIIAGLNPPRFLVEKIARYPHIQLKENCSEQEMNELIENAQIHCLYTPQATGLKLKLLNVLFKGRFVIANDFMVHGTELSMAITIANQPDDYIYKIKQHFTETFDEQLLQIRKDYLKKYCNQHQVNSLIEIITTL
ncbi:MAG: glycosyltransferase family 1 protein [Bacteroidia bacterium]|nr:glycosyltransferase family 1 protein [Bacteroidia bacterium]